jgi:hypothetical protein
MQMLAAPWFLFSLLSGQPAQTFKTALSKTQE